MDKAIRCLYYQYFRFNDVRTVVNRPENYWKYTDDLRFLGIEEKECIDVFKEIAVMSEQDFLEEDYPYE